ncbi:MAG: tetratricopeptide repeat protein [Cyanobacteria bacterium P01_G01_bin.54]
MPGSDGIAGARTNLDSTFEVEAPFEPWCPEAVEVFQDLIRALRRKKGFGLFFVQCSGAMEQNVIVSIHEQLPQKQVAEFILNRESETLYGDLIELHKREQFEIVFVTGLEQSLSKYEDIKRSAGWSSLEIYNYSWKDVPPLMSHLNQQRENFEQNLPIALVFLIESYVVDYFIQRAPDFFDWRSGLFELIQGEAALQDSILDMLMYYNQNETTLTRAECNQRIREIDKKLQQLDEQKFAEKSKLLQEQGRAFAALGDTEQALDCYNLALGSDPDSDSVLISRGQLLENQNQYQSALADYDRALELNPNLQVAWHRHGITLEALGEDDLAIASYDKALSIESQNMDCWYRRGELLIKSKNYTQALQNFDDALHFAPNADEFWHLKSVTHYWLEQQDLALKSIEKALYINPEHVTYWHHKGILLKSTKQYKAAIDSFDKIIAINPYHDKAWLMRGEIMQIIGHLEEAQKSLERAVAINPRNSEAWHRLCVIDLLENHRERFRDIILEQDLILEVMAEVGLTTTSQDDREKAINVIDLPQDLRELLHSIILEVMGKVGLVTAT